MVSDLEVLLANDLEVRVDNNGRYTPTPAVSHAILTNPGTDGIVITPSHNPPRDGGFKYNPPSGGPADADATDWIAARANDYLRQDLAGRSEERRVGKECRSGMAPYHTKKKEQ